jgi:hypothetical protein
MPDISSAIGGALSIGSALFKDDGTDSAVSAGNQGINNALTSNRKSLEEIQNMFKPYMQAGTGALTGQQDILGLNGNTAQQNSLNSIQSSPIFQGLMSQGENSILQNASATGGLRGGNTQKALSQFSPNLLNTLLQQKLQGLQGLTNLGFNASGANANAVQNFGGINADLLTGQGRINAGGAVDKASNFSGLLDTAGNGAGRLFGGDIFGGTGALFGGTGLGSTAGTLGADLAFGMF